MLRLFTIAAFVQHALATSVAVATSPIVSTITSTSYFTSSSIVSTSISMTTFGSCSPTTLTSGVTTSVCISGARASEVPVYDSDVFTIAVEIVTTIGYHTIYSDVPDGSTPPTPSSTSSSISSGNDGGSNSLGYGTAALGGGSSGTAATSIAGAGVTNTAGSTNTAGNAETTGGSKTTGGTETTGGPETTGRPRATSSSGSSSNGSSGGESDSSSGGLSVGLKAAAAVAILLGAALGACIAVLIVKRRRYRRKQQTRPTEGYGSNIEKGELDGMTVAKKPGSSPPTTASGTSIRSPNGQKAGATVTGAEIKNIDVYEVDGHHQRPTQQQGGVNGDAPASPVRDHADKAIKATLNRKFDTGGTPLRGAQNIKRHEVGGQARHEVHGNAFHEAHSQARYEMDGNRYYETQGNPRYEMTANEHHIHELEDNIKRYSVIR